MFNKVLDATKTLRHKTAFAVVGLLAPKLRADLEKLYRVACNDTPRPFTKMLKAVFEDKPLVGCEIGFGYGGNAESLLTELNIKQLYCVDPFFASKGYMDTGVFVDWFAKPNKSFYERFNKLEKTGKVTYVCSTSDNAFLVDILPHDLDFIYIDGNHSKEFCYRDIVNGFLYAKPGAYIGGHDFANGSLVEVGEAVFDYALFSGLKPTVVFPDFWFKKPGPREQALRSNH